jgi:DNA replication licensing factor MCM3
MQMEVDDNEKFFNDFVSKMHITDPHTLKVDIDQLRKEYPLTAEDLIKNPQKYYKITKNYLERAEHGDQRVKYEAKIQHYKISFEGNLGANFVTPRGLGSKMANELVGIQGIITKMDNVKYYLEKSVHYCEKTKGHEVKEYPDNMNPEKDFEPNKTRFIKTHDENNHPLSF